MPRKARVILPNQPHHLVHWGRDHQAMFLHDDFFQIYINCLKELRTRLGLKVYAYCLMQTHVHLLLAPGNDPTTLGQAMKSLATRITRYRNQLAGCSGSQWENRYQSSPVEMEHFLLACCRFIELNPVRTGLVTDPADYCWSSFRQRMCIDAENWLDSAPGFNVLGPTGNNQRKRYREFLCEPVPTGEWQLIREAVRRGQLTGGRRFTREVARRTGRLIERRGPGRPRLTNKHCREGD